MQYTIKFEKYQDEDYGYITIPIVEIVEKNDGIGDFISIYMDGNVLEFDEFIDVDDKDIRDFIKQYFKDYKAVLGFMRRILN